MSDPAAFRSVLRGYDPAQVERHVADLAAALDGERAARVELAGHVQALEQHLAARAAEDAAAVVSPEALQPTYADLGHRVSQILALSEEEAQDVLARASADAEALRGEAEAHARLVRADADRYDEAVRSDAQTEVERLLAEARLHADEVVDAAERGAAVLREEAAATWEEARSQAAQAATDFELALATRRHRTEVDAQELQRVRAEELEHLERRVAQARDQADAVEADATARSEDLLAAARHQADELVAQARERAAAVRAESQRELEVAQQRRDSINAQLANVRQMLATLSGGASAPEGSVPVTGLDLDLDAEEPGRTYVDQRAADRTRSAQEV